MSRSNSQQFRDQFLINFILNSDDNPDPLKSYLLQSYLKDSQDNNINTSINNDTLSIPSNFNPYNNSNVGGPKPKKVSMPSPVVPVETKTPQPTTPKTSKFNSSNTLYYGDSIATGLGHGGARGNNNSDAMWGRGAADTLAILNNRPEGTFKGKDVVLSSGVLNSGADWDTVRSQVRLLKNKGANSISLVGAPSNNERFSGYNSNLSRISKEEGVSFLNGYKAGDDGVHFDYSSSPVYRPLN